LAIVPPIDDWVAEEGIADEEMLERLKTATDQAFAGKTALVDRPAMQNVEKQVLLQIIDSNWREHLQQLDHLKSVIGFRAYGQRDPLNEYKSEAFTLFDNLLTNLREGVTRLLMNLQVQAREPEPAPTLPVFAHPPRAPQDLIGAGAALSGPAPDFDVSAYEQSNGRIPRNAQCPCGSDRKFKHCHGRL